MRDLAQLPIDVDQSQQRVVEAARDQLAVAVEDERIRLVAQERELAGEREDVLHRAVVKVEAEPHQPALAGSHESRSRAALRSSRCSRSRTAATAPAAASRYVALVGRRWPGIRATTAA